jgi:hypothetical protein
VGVALSGGRRPNLFRRNKLRTLNRTQSTAGAEKSVGSDAIPYNPLAAKGKVEVEAFSFKQPEKRQVYFGRQG